MLKGPSDEAPGYRAKRGRDAEERHRVWVRQYSTRHQGNNNQRRRHPVTAGKPSRCRGAAEIPVQHTRREGPRRRLKAGSGPSRRATAGFITQHYTL